MALISEKGLKLRLKISFYEEPPKQLQCLASADPEKACSYFGVRFIKEDKQHI
jgi:hypothetical protein